MRVPRTTEAFASRITATTAATLALAEIERRMVFLPRTGGAECKKKEPTRKSHSRVIWVIRPVRRHISGFLDRPPVVCMPLGQ
jgi:hypothetical protein